MNFQPYPHASANPAAGVNGQGGSGLTPEERSRVQTPTTASREKSPVSQTQLLKEPKRSDRPEQVRKSKNLPNLAFPHFSGPATDDTPMGESEAALRARIEEEVKQKFLAQARALEEEANKLSRIETTLAKREKEHAVNADHVRSTISSLTDSQLAASKLAIESRSSEERLLKQAQGKDDTIAELTTGEQNKPKGVAGYKETLSLPSTIRRTATIKSGENDDAGRKGQGICP